MKNKTIYLYPRCEDSSNLAVTLDFLKERGIVGDYCYIDDARREESLVCNLNKIRANGELWIVHQDENIARILWDNARNSLNEEFIFDGIIKVENILVKYVKNLECDFEDVSYQQWLNHISRFVLSFGIFLQNHKSKSIVFILKEIGDKATHYFQKFYKIPKKSVGVYGSNYLNNKHYGDIIDILKKQGISVYVFSEIGYLGYFINFLDMFALSIRTLMPFANVIKTKTQHIYIPHAYIDPIASLVQRNRPLDGFWFKKKFGINGYRIVPSHSNYLIYKDKAEELGYEDEIVCGGYPSLDVNIEEYEKVKCEDGNNILIAIHEKENLNVIKKLIVVVLEKNKQKLIFRPYPSHKNDSDFIALKNTFKNNQNFIYDDSPKLTAEMMKNCCVLIGDWSSLVWTFPFTTLKPAILLFQDKKILENSYNGVKFYNPTIHLIASNVDELLSCIEESQKNTKKRAEEIFEFRKKEVFNLGHSSEFIADFIIKKFNELK